MQRFEERSIGSIPGGYDWVGNFCLAEGLPLYMWGSYTGSRVMHGETASPIYDGGVSDLQWRDGRPLYVARSHGRIELDQIIWGRDTGIKHPFVTCLTEEGGKLVFYAQHAGPRQKSFAQFGDEQGPEFDEIFAHDFQVADGVPFYAARRGKDTLMVWGKREYHGLRPDFPEGFRFACGRPVYEGFDRKGRWFHAWGDDRFPGGEKYLTFEQFTVVDGKPLRWGYFGGRHQMFWGNDEVRTPGRVLSRPVKLRGEICFLADRGFEHEAVVWGDRMFGRYNRIGGFCIKNDAPLYFGYRAGSCFLVHDETEYEIREKHVHDYDVVGGAPLLVLTHRYEPAHGGADSRTAYSVVHGSTRSKEYDEVFSLGVSEGAIEFGARRGNRLFRLTKPIAAGN